MAGINFFRALPFFFFFFRSLPSVGQILLQATPHPGRNNMCFQCIPRSAIEVLHNRKPQGLIQSTVTLFSHSLFFLFQFL